MGVNLILTDLCCMFAAFSVFVTIIVTLRPLGETERMSKKKIQTKLSRTDRRAEHAAAPSRKRKRKRLRGRKNGLCSV